MVKFFAASLFYGLGRYPVDRSELLPFADFDLEGDLQQQAFDAMAIMSNASGGHTMKKAVLRVHPEYVVLMGDGFSVQWGETLTYMNAGRILNEMVVHQVPFNVLATPLTYGWKSAVKSAVVV